jgi:hypothetical protein
MKVSFPIKKNISEISCKDADISIWFFYKYNVRLYGSFFSDKIEISWKFLEKMHTYLHLAFLKVKHMEISFPIKKI